MAFKKGQSGNPAGKPVGTKAKLSSTVKQTVLDVFLNLQGIEGFSLLHWVSSDPKNLKDFYTGIAPKLIPTEITGDPANPLQMQHSLKPEDKDIITRYTQQMERK